MPMSPRTVDVHLLVLATIALNAETLHEALAAERHESVVQLVAAEVRANLETLSYMTAVAVVEL